VAEQKLGEGDTTYVTYVKKAGEAKPTPFVVDSSITPDYEASFPTVPPDQVLVLGDNRPGSCDAHVWLERGAEFTPQSNVIGQAELIYWPITRVRFLS
jgi:signal peptidase I